MGLAGRDPVFYAQVESELAYIATIENPILRKKYADFVDNTCFHCHGVMGQRQFAQAHPAQTFDPNVVNHSNNLYGSLARDGISCLQPVPPHQRRLCFSGGFPHEKTTGNFDLIANDEVEGPFGDNHIVVDPMKNSLGLHPQVQRIHDLFAALRQLSRNRSSGRGSSTQEYSLEQNTYAEWLNSHHTKTNSIPVIPRRGPARTVICGIRTRTRSTT